VETCFGCCSSSFSLRTNILFGFSSAMWFIIVYWFEYDIKENEKFHWFINFE
jgi:hypothetical protein